MDGTLHIKVVYWDTPRNDAPFATMTCYLGIGQKRWVMGELPSKAGHPILFETSQTSTVLPKTRMPVETIEGNCGVFCFRLQSEKYG